MRKPKERSRILKKLSRPPGGDRAGERNRCIRHRGVVCGRSTYRSEEQDFAALGQAWDTAFCPTRSAHRLRLLFGAICPRDGKGAGLIMPRCDSAAMSLHLAEIAQEVSPGAHAVLILDQAGWHMSKSLVVPQNITLIPLPPKCPELNPV